MVRVNGDVDWPKKYPQQHLSFLLSWENRVTTVTHLVGLERQNVQRKGGQAGEKDDLKSSSLDQLVRMGNDVGHFTREQTHNADLEQRQRTHFAQQVHWVQF